MKRNFKLRPLPAYIITSVFVALVCGSTVLMLVLRRDELDEEFIWLAVLPAALFLLWTVLTALIYVRTRKRYDSVFMEILSTFPKEDVEAFMEYTERLPEPEEISRWVCGKLESYERARFNNMAALSGVSMSREIFWRISKKSNRVDVGEYWENTYGVTNLGKTKDIRLMLDPATRAEFDDGLRKIIDNVGESFNLYGKLELSSEKSVAVFIRGKCMKSPATGEKVCMGTVSDLDMETKLSERLKEEKQKSRFLMAASTDIFYEVNVSDNRLKALNPKVSEAILGITDMQDFDGERRPYWELIHPDDREGFVDRFFNYDHMTIMPDQKMVYEYRVKNKDGDYIWVEHHAQAIAFEDNKVTRIIGRISDITEKKRNTLKQRTNVDALTGAFLRTSVAKEFENPIYDGNTRCVILFNINSFHIINNLYGYEAGDSVLRELVMVLWEQQQGRCAVGRIEDDTFVVAMMDITKDHTPEKVSDRTLARFEQPRNVNGTMVNIALSAGSSGRQTGKCTFDECYEKAALALKVSKQTATAYTNVFTEYTDSLREQFPQPNEK